MATTVETAIYQLQYETGNSARNIAALKGEVDALSQATDHLTQTATGKMRDALSGVNSAVATLSRSWVGLAAIIAGTAVGVLSNVTSDLVGFEKAAREANLSLQDFQATRGAASLKGIGGEDFDKSVAGLAKALNDARREENDLSKFLDANNIKFKEGTRLVIDTNRALEIAARLIRQAREEQDKVKVAKAFGVEELLPLLRGGVDEFVRLKSEAEAAGAVIDDGVIKSAVAFDREWTRVMATWTIKFKAMLLQAATDAKNFIAEISNIEIGGMRLLPSGQELEQIKRDILSLPEDAQRRWQSFLGALESVPALKGIKDDLGDLSKFITVNVSAAERLNHAFQTLEKRKPTIAVSTYRNLPDDAGPGGVNFPVDDKKAEREREWLRRANEQRESRIEALRLERDALGLTADEAEVLRIVTAELNKENERGIETDGERTKSIFKQAEEMVKLRKEIEQTRETARLFEQASSSFIGPFLRAMSQGKDAAEALRSALEGVGSSLSSIGTRMVSTQLGNLFSGQAVNASQLGVGAGVALIGTAVSGIMSNMERRAQRQANLREQQIQTQQRIDALRQETALAGLDTGTREGALAAYDIQNQARLAPLQATTKGGRIGKTAELIAAEDAVAAGRLAIIKRFDDAAIADEKRRATEIERLRMDFADREFAAMNDTSTLAGQLAAFNRSAARERLDVAKEFADLLPDLERAQAAERLAIQRDFHDATIEDYKRTSDQIRSYLDGLKLGALSTLSPEHQFEEARRQFETQFALAKTGGEAGAGARAGITGSLDQFLQIAREFLGPSQQYGQLFDQYTSQLGTLPGMLGMGSSAAGPAVTPISVPMLPATGGSIPVTVSAPSNDNLAGEVRALNLGFARLAGEVAALRRDNNERQDEGNSISNGIRSDLRQNATEVSIRAKVA